MWFKTASGEAEFMASYDAALAQWPVPYEALRLPTRFGATHITVSGPEDGPPLVLLHAAGTSSTVWLRNIGALGQAHRTYMVDTIDEPGKSRWSAPFRTRADCAGWVADVLDGLHIDRAHLGGMSRGGWLSMNFALAAPQRLKSLTLLAPMGFARPRLSFFLHFLGPMLYPTRAGLRRTLRWLSATDRVDEGLAEQMFLAVKHFRFPKGGIFPTVYSDEELRGLGVPALLLVGEREVLYDPKRALDRAMRLIPGLRAELIPDAGHLLIMEQTDRANRLILKFLASAEGRPGPD